MTSAYGFASNSNAQWAPLPVSVRSSPSADFSLELTAHRDQTWVGFGGCFNEAGWEALEHVPAATRDQVLDRLFAVEGDLRLNYCRVPIGASDYALEWYAHHDRPDDYAMDHFSISRDECYLLPYLREALRRRPDLRLFASPWSPPVWMKRPRAYNYGRLREEPAIQHAYALYLLRFVEAYRAAGVRVEALHVQNEPNSDQKFPSCVWTGAQMRDFVRDYLGPCFAAAGEGCEIWLGTLERCGQAGAPDGFDHWVNLVLADPAARRYVRGIGYQWAGKWLMARTRAAWPEFPIVQTENECGNGSNTWEYAGYVFDLCQHYLAHGAVAYVYWNMVLPSGGESTWGWKQNSLFRIDRVSGQVHTNPEFWVLKHYAHAVVPGARRISTRGRLSAQAVAFANPDGSRVVVLKNPFDHVLPVHVTEGDRHFAGELPPRAFATVILA
jgi:glucosylceramidase